jgi:GAF domain-containing protein
VAEFRLYFLDGKGSITTRHDFHAETGDEAMEFAAVVFNACSDRTAGYEVWSGKQRLIQSLTTNSVARLDALRGARQERVIELKEALGDTLRAAAQSRRAAKSVSALPRPALDPITPEQILRYICAATGTEMLSLQFVEEDRLKLRGTQGFGRRFIEFFDIVDDEGCACGAALKEMRQLVVPSIESSRIFAGHESLEELRAAGVNACVSTPLLRAGDGGVVGMFSVHKRRLWTPDSGELDQLKSLARQISAALADPLSAAAQTLRAAG